MSRRPERVRVVYRHGDLLVVNGRSSTMAQYRRALERQQPPEPRWPLPLAAGGRGRKRAVDGRRALRGCDHDFEYREDWEGDPGVINGTHTLCWLECMHCGEERSASYDDRPSHDDYDY